MRPRQRFAVVVKIAEQRQTSIFQHPRTVRILSVKAGDVVVNKLRCGRVVADDDETGRYGNILFFPQVKDRFIMPVKGIKCREQSRGKRKRIKRTVFAFFGHVLSDMFPKVAEHG